MLESAVFALCVFAWAERGKMTRRKKVKSLPFSKGRGVCVCECVFGGGGHFTYASV